MEHEDEKIIAMRNAEKRKQYTSIETGFYVGDELIKFAECRLFDDRMSIMLPDGFTDMSLEDAKKKYPSENRPQIIKTDSDGSVNFTFSRFEQPMQADQIKDTVDDLRLMLRKAHPANLFIEDGQVEFESTICRWFDFKGYTINGTIYNVLFVAPVENGFILGMFNCPFEVWPSWKPVVLLLLGTIIDLTGRT